MAALTMPASLYAAETVYGASVQAVTQQNQVKGTVYDETGDTMIGVTVKVKGTNVGAITDLEGNFTINANAGATLEVSYVGYTTQEVKVVAGKPLVINLKPDSQVMEEVVVIGYGTQKKRDLTGAITSVKSDDITLNPGTNAMDALQGKVAGLDITKSSGQAGAAPSMQLRGNRSISADGNPLFIIDGMPGDYATLNPNDIESIEVLKDASSTAIYGSAGANGVVLITTKNGKEGKLAVNFNAYLGINGWSTTPKMMSGDTFMDALRTSKKNGGTYVDDATMFSTKPAYYDAYLAGKNINWADELLKTGITQNYSLSISGGTEKVKSYISMNYSDEEGQYRNDNYQVFSTNMRVENKVSNLVTIGLNFQGSYVHQNKPFAKLDDVLTKLPYGDVMDADGNYVTYINGDQNFINPLINNFDNYRNVGDNTKLYINPFVRITPMKGLTFESRVNGTLTYSKTGTMTGIGSFNYYNNNGATSAASNNSRSYNYKWENILTYNFQINKDHDFTLTGVTSWNHNRSESANASGTGITDNKMLWYNLAACASRDASSSYSMSKGMGYIARVNYSYLGKYLFSASMRWDGSSVLAAGHKWSSFPAVSAGWRVSDESFMESTKSWLDNLKLRVSYGETGTAKISAYSSASSLNQSMAVIGGDLISPAYTYKQTIANHSLTWERSKSFDIGIDAGFLNGRINATLDWYLTNTDGVIWNKSLPVTNGAFSYNSLYNTNVNLAKTRSTGIEAAINTRNVKTKDFTWNSALTFSWNHGEITKLSGTENDEVINGSTIYKVGHEINSFYHFKLNGIWGENEAADAAVFGRKPGDIKIDVPGVVRHVNPDGSVYYTKVDADGNENTYDAANPYNISSNDQQVLGHNTPSWTLGFQNVLTYKGFDLTVYMYMRWGQTINYSMLTSYDPQMGNNFPTYFLDKIGTVFPRLDSEIARSNITEFYGLSFVDGSFFKIKNVTLGYTLPKNVLKTIGIEKLRVYGTITNPLIIAKSGLLKNYDPEMNGGLNYPLTKQLVFGVNVTF